MNKKRYWLRIGMVGVILGPIILFCFFKLTTPTSVPVMEFPVYDGMVMVLIVYGSAALRGFIVGSIIGWIYGKVKSRKQVGAI